MHVAAYIEELQGSLAAPSVKQHLAAIRMLFDWLVLGQVLPSNPASVVRGPHYSSKKGKTPVLSSDEARELLASIEAGSYIGRRDRALIGTMAYTPLPAWARRCRCGSKTCGKCHELPCHHKIGRALGCVSGDDGLAEGAERISVSHGRLGVRRPDGPGLVPIRRLPHDSPSHRRCGPQDENRQSHLSRHRDYVCRMAAGWKSPSKWRRMSPPGPLGSTTAAGMRSILRRSSELESKGRTHKPSALPETYSQLVAEIKQRIQTAQLRASLAVNRELVLLYWQIGRDILTRQERESWGAKVIDRLAADLKSAFPDTRGFFRPGT